MPKRAATGAVGMSSSPDPAVQDYLTEVAHRCRDVVGDEVVGVYAGGSLALDGYRPGRSDIDVAVVVAGRLDDEAKRSLVSALRHESLPCPARGLELVVYRADVAASGRVDPGFEVELNTGARMDFRATFDPAARPPQDGSFWYAVDRSILHEHGKAVFGPPAVEVFGEVGGLRSVLAESVRWHLDHARADGVLGAHRALIRVRTGRWVSKLEAARIVQEEALHELSR